MYTNMHKHRFNGHRHFPGEPDLAGCHLSFPFPFIPLDCTLLGQSQTFHFLRDTVTSSLQTPQTTSSSSNNKQNYTVPGRISVQ